MAPQGTATLPARLGRMLFEHFVLRRVHAPALAVRYWDGRVARNYPDGRPVTATLTIRDPSALWRILRCPSLGFGDAYAAGTLEVEGDIQTLLRTLCARGWRRSIRLPRLRRRVSRTRAERNARFHYDTGNDFFRRWLDPSLTYSCAYFRSQETTLAEAQQDKLDLICRKLSLQPGMKLLDVGCGWGSLLLHAVEHYGVNGYGITPSREQQAYLCHEAQRRGMRRRLAVPPVTHWRDISGSYDRVVSVGMYEHVGKGDGRAFFRHWQRWLAPGGISLLHTIGTTVEGVPPDPWITTRIFPGGYLPTLSELTRHSARAGLFIEHVDNLWQHYVLTLQRWTENLESAYEEIADTIGERGYRTWWLYLQISKAAFHSGRLALFQCLLTQGKVHDQSLTRETWYGPLPRPREASV